MTSWSDIRIYRYASGGDLRFPSSDLTDDEKTTRIYTCMLASEC